MSGSDLSTAPGLFDLLGKGVFIAIPEELPETLRGAPVVVAGEPAACASGVRRLLARGCVVMLVTPGAGRPGGNRGAGRPLAGLAGVGTRHSTEIVWAVGIEYLEALVLRHIPTGRIDACNATALFIVPSPEGGQGTPPGRAGTDGTSRTSSLVGGRAVRLRWRGSNSPSSE